MTIKSTFSRIYLVNSDFFCIFASDFESWGSGVQRILDACKAQGVPEPYYKLWADGTIVLVFPMPSADKRNCGSGCGNNCESNCESQLTARQRVIYQLLNGVSVNDTVNDTINDTVSDTIKWTAQTIATYTQIPLVSVKRYLAELVKKGLIRRIGSDKTGHWEVVENEET